MTSRQKIDRTIDLTDYLVIGSGIAGVRAAIQLGRHGRVLMVNKGNPPQSASEFAQGGIAVALDPEDSVEAHMADTLQAGKGLCRTEAVEVLVKEGPLRVQELIQWGARFDREGERYVLAREAAHRRARILRRGDATGTEIMRTLLTKAKPLRTIRRLPPHFTSDLLVHQGRCIGAVLLSGTGGVRVVGAKAVLLATGGAGQVYSRTTNPPVATGDGMAMAYRAGCVLEDMEFVQFHPTALALPNAPAFLLTEALRGEGAVLRTTQGNAFMKRYDPAGELATRDIVSQAIWQEMQAQHASHVYLDVTHLKAKYIRERFPTVAQTCLRYGLDITKTPIPVAPSAHFMIGGAKTSLTGATSLDGLYAAGEVACSGIHGANRLASNSLLEGLVFGVRAGEAMLASSRKDAVKRSEIQSIFDKNRPSWFTTHQSVFPAQLGAETDRLKEMMWNRVGIVRNQASLTEAVTLLEHWGFLRTAPIVSQAEGEFKNMVTVASMIVRAALLRRNSVGAHYRSDDPDVGKSPDLRHIAFRLSNHPQGDWV
ncbi:MAG TPA: L-aspartate oxidase [Nitrospiria bacterium]|nr:L-aspartate oxidase [Nitrospiria bacterium]